LENPAGLSFWEVVKRLRERQYHAVSRGTMRPTLYGVGFERGGDLWFALLVIVITPLVTPIPISEAISKEQRQERAERERQAQLQVPSNDHDLIITPHTKSAKQLALLLLDSQSQVLAEKGVDVNNGLPQSDSLPLSPFETLRRRAKTIRVNLAQLILKMDIKG
jgi:virulence-associated protein VagC